MELGLAQPAARRVDIDADERADPRLGLERGSHERTELTAHTADEYPLTAHAVRLPAGSTAGQHASSRWWLEQPLIYYRRRRLTRMELLLSLL